MKTIKKRASDFNTMSLFGDEAIAEFATPITYIKTTSTLEEELPEFDFNVYLENAFTAKTICTLPVVTTPETTAEVLEPTCRAISTANSISVLRNTRNFRMSTDSIPQGVSSVDARIQANLTALQLLKQLQADGREANESEKATLARYSGWGGLTRAFMPTGQYRSQIEALLTEREFDSASAGILTQHFTPDFVVDFMYSALIKLGVKPKRMLDPSVGSGIFAARIPDQWRSDVVIYGSEIDPVLASITAMLLPDVQLQPKAFEAVKFPDNAFDLVMTNVPFSPTKTFDEETPSQSLSLHNFFIAKALRKVRPGGVVAVVTSSFTLDSQDDKVRSMFADQADLIAAARLPDWVFKSTASTEVSSDVLIFRKRTAEDMVQLNPSWIHTQFKQNALLNNQMESTPAWWMGEAKCLPGRYSPRWVAVCSPEEVQGHMQAWLDNLPDSCCVLQAQDVAANANIEQQLQYEHLRKLRPGSFAEHDGRIVKVSTSGDVNPVDMNDAKAQRIHAYIGMRETIKRLLLLQLNSEDDAPVKAARYELNMRYDAFVAKFQAVNARYNRSLLKSDPDYPLVSALEVFDFDNQTATKSPIMKVRTVRPRTPATSAANAEEALLLTLNEVGRIDLQRTATLCGKDVEQVQVELREKGRIYLNPENRNWEIAEVYLSGDILQKLEVAEFAAQEEAQFEINAQALRASMPERIAFKDIAIQLGATFLQPKHIEDFIDHLMENESATRAAEVEHAVSAAKWRLKNSRQEYGNDTSLWGTSRITGRKLVEMSLNMMTPTIRDRKENEDKKVTYVINPDQTLAAREKQMAIQEEFKTWIGRDEMRVKTIEDTYNRLFNTSRPINPNGEHLKLPGLNEAISLRASQKNSIWRNLIGGNNLVGHAVGAGKTLIGICTAMEAKRLGIRRCSLITVPNNIVGQFTREFINAYPCANLLVIESNEGDKSHREHMLARVATGNYDAVIMSHVTFKSFGVSEAMLESVVRPWYQAINRQQAYATDRTMLKSLERRKTALDEMVKKTLADAKNCPFTFDQLGCDQLIVDESQAFKNLWYTTSMEPVPGLPTTFSRRAFDMFVKVRGLSAQNDEKGGVIFMSATPIANTVAELFHLMRYMILPTLIAKGIDQFDAWAANYGRTVISIETTPDGGSFRLQTRFARFENVPELMALFGLFADIQTKEDLKLPTPRIAGGKPCVIAVPASQALKDYVQSLAKRAEKIQSKDPKERPNPKQDNMLKVTTDGRKAALDMRLVGGMDDPGSKVNVAVETIYRIWEETRARRLTQLIFCDLGTPGNTRCDIYQDIKDKLMRKGVPECEIAFAHDYKTPSKKALLEARMNRGDIRITLATTDLLGVGSNVQRLLYAEHELDCPWRPDQVEQRGGRIERQGNLNEEICMFRYVTEQSFDAYNWTIVEQKLRFILQVMTSKCAVRSIEDIEVRALTVAEVKALATGNPRIMERAVLQQREAKLSSLSRTFYSEQRESQLRISQSGNNVVTLSENLERVLEDVATAAANPDEGAITISNRHFGGTDKQAIADALQSAFGEASAKAIGLRNNKTVLEIGAYRGFKLGIICEFNQVSLGYNYEWCLEGSLRWGTEVGTGWQGNYTRIQNLVNRLPNEANKRKERLLQIEKAVADTQKACAGVFPRSQELMEVREQLRLLEIELGIADLDIQATEIETDNDILELET